MNNKHVGLIIVGFAFILGIVIYFFNRALSQIVTSSCDHGEACPMWGSISFHTNITIALMFVVLAIGLYLIFFGDKKVSVNKKSVKDFVIPENLNPDEKSLLKLVVDEEGAVFQSSLVEKSGFSKVKTTRLLDKLEGRDLIERRRRGMTNVVLLKH